MQANKPSMLRVVVPCLLLWFSAFPVSGAAQGTRGQNAVYNAQGNCGSSCVPSSAFIDASQFGSNTTNICAVLNFILTPGNSIIPSTGAVIDARGLPGSTNTNMTCSSSPWAGIANPPPTNILLPAGTITIQAGWVIPKNTHLIGQGDNLPTSQGLSSGTTIVAANSSVNPMISFCSSACTGVAIEKLVLNGNGLTVTGIKNSFAGTLSYVDHVGLYHILGTGLWINSAAATGSGPYSNINFTISTSVPTTICAKIDGVNGTGGIRNLSCINNNQVTIASAGVLLDSSNNSIKDLNIAGFTDGVLVGANATATNNVLINVYGDTVCCTTGTPPVVNVVHVSSNNTVSDIALMGVSNGVNVANQYTVRDEVTGTILPVSTDPIVGLYALGKASNNGYARFTTSPSVPSWATGTQSPPGGSCAQGSIYSCTASGCSHVLWGCPAPGGTWAYIK